MFCKIQILQVQVLHYVSHLLSGRHQYDKKIGKGSILSDRHSKPHGLWSPNQGVLGRQQQLLLT